MNLHKLAICFSSFRIIWWLSGDSEEFKVQADRKWWWFLGGKASDGLAPGQRGVRKIQQNTLNVFRRSRIDSNFIFKMHKAAFEVMKFQFLHLWSIFYITYFFIAFLLKGQQMASVCFIFNERHTSGWKWNLKKLMFACKTDGGCLKNVLKESPRVHQAIC